MRPKRIPTISRNPLTNSITISYGLPKCSLIWLHGLCDTSQGFFPYFTHYRSPVYHGVKIKLIQAPLRNITANNGTPCHAWFDVRNHERFKGEERENVDFLDVGHSQEIVDGHVKQEVKQWEIRQPSSQINPFHRIFIGGFSQGGVLSLKYALQTPMPPAGIISFSGYMFQTVSYTNFKKVPILLMHGTHDPIIQQIMARRSYEKLISDENLVRYYPVEKLGHTVNLEQLDVMGDWIDDVLGVIRHVYQKQGGGGMGEKFSRGVESRK